MLLEHAQQITSIRSLERERKGGRVGEEGKRGGREGGREREEGREGGSLVGREGGGDPQGCII